MRKLYPLFFLIVLVSTIPLVNGVVVYTETQPTTNLGDSADPDGWNVIDAGSAPALSVAEIIVINTNSTNAVALGVRETGSALARYVNLNEAEGVTLDEVSARFLVQVDASGEIEYYSDGWGSAWEILLSGYWTGITFNEQWVPYFVTSSEDDTWHETDGSELSLMANYTHLITLLNKNVGSEDSLGVRNTTSALDRRISLMESESNGNQTFTMFVQSDADSKIDVYSSDYADVYFINQGYFQIGTYFQEDFINHVASASVVWENWDVSFYIDQNGRVCDFVFGNGDPDFNNLGGVRTDGSALQRRIRNKEAESGGFSLTGMSSISSGSGIIEVYSGDNAHCEEWFMGYFYPPTAPIPPPPYVGNVTLLFGAGFNWSTPYIYLKWEYTGNVTNYQVTHSTDNVTYSLLVYTANRFYNHTGLVNGSIHYYRVRSTYFNVSWYNSSYSPRNLERVWFIPGAGGGGGAGNVTIINVTKNYACEYRNYNISSWINETGFVNYGSFVDLAFVDNLNQSIKEVVGVPGFDMRYNFTGIPENISCINILIRAEYSGNLAHVVWVEAFNFSSGQWRELMLIPDNLNYEWFNCSLSAFAPTDFLNNGSVWIKVDHESAGNINHVLWLDFIQLRGLVSFEVFPLLSAWDINWITALIWLAITTIGVFRTDKIIIFFAGFFGLILGIFMLSISSMVAVALICLNLYLIYEGTEV